MKKIIISRKKRERERKKKKKKKIEKKKNSKILWKLMSRNVRKQIIAEKKKSRKTQNFSHND